MLNKRFTLRILGMISALVFSSNVSAAVLYDNSFTGRSYDVTQDAGAGYGLYSVFPFWPGTGSLFSGYTGATMSSDVRYLRVKRISGVSCATPVNIFISRDNGNPLGSGWPTPNSGTASGDYCDFPLGGSSSGQRLGAVFFCISNGCNSSLGTMVLDGSIVNDGFAVDGTQTIHQQGGWGFQVCDSGGCSGGFSAPVIKNVSGNISTSTIFASTTMYVLSGNIVVTASSTLTLEPGSRVKFDTSTSSSLVINGTLNAIGYDNNDYVNPIKPIIFTSYKDDLIWGDTNNDGTSTTPITGDWGGITVNMGGTANLHYSFLRYGGGSAASSTIYNNGGIVNISTSTLLHGGIYGIKNSAGTSTITASDISNNSYGVYMNGGSVTINATSTIHNNSLYGVYNNTTFNISAGGNYWGDSSGPYHSTNITGLGNAVTDYVNFASWVSTSTLHYVGVDCPSVTCGAVDDGEIAVYSETIHAHELNLATSTWSALGSINWTTALSSTTANVIILDDNLEDVVWKGQYTDSTPGILLLNNYYLLNNSTAERVNTIQHELGHALGLRHSYAGNVMFLAQSSQTSLGPQDIADYVYLWSN